LNNKNVSLQNNISEFANNIHKANVYIETNESKLKQAFEDNLSYKQSNEDLMHKLSAQRNEIERVSFELNNMIEQSKQLNTMNKELMHDNENKAKALNDALYQKNAFEERIVILNKEKKLYDRILNTMCYCSNIKNVSSIISDLMKIVDDIAMIEREKVKLHNEGRNVNAVECKLLEKHKEFDAVYQVFQKELNKQKEMPLSKKNGGSKDTYLYTSTNNNTNNSVNGFSPVHTYMDNNSSYQKHKTMNSDYDRYGTLHSGEYSMYKSSV
jgi:DNA repair exonuclease SbcCD ATPase subunit